MLPWLYFTPERTSGAEVIVDSLKHRQRNPVDQPWHAIRIDPKDPVAFLAERVPICKAHTRHLESFSAVGELANLLHIKHIQAGIGSVRLDETNIVVVGGPAQGGFARALFGSSFDNSFLPNKDPYVFPYMFGPSVDDILRPIEDTDRFASSPGWTIRVRDQALSAGLDANKRLTEDLLLLTVLPNPYSIDRSIVSIAGTHGVGTRAGYLILQDQAIVRKLTEIKSRSFQVIFKVDRLVSGQATAIHYLMQDEVTVRAGSDLLLQERIRAVRI